MYRLDAECVTVGHCPFSADIHYSSLYSTIIASIPCVLKFISIYYSNNVIIERTMGYFIKSLKKYVTSESLLLLVLSVAVIVVLAPVVLALSITYLSFYAVALCFKMFGD
jgi:ABC-type arginine transport system permease subunit